MPSHAEFIRELLSDIQCKMQAIERLVALMEAPVPEPNCWQQNLIKSRIKHGPKPEVLLDKTDKGLIAYSDSTKYILKVRGANGKFHPWDATKVPEEACTVYGAERLCLKYGYEPRWYILGGSDLYLVKELSMQRSGQLST